MDAPHVCGNKQSSCWLHDYDGSNVGFAELLWLALEVPATVAHSGSPHRLVRVDAVRGLAMAVNVEIALSMAHSCLGTILRN